MKICNLIYEITISIKKKQNIEKKCKKSRQKHYVNYDI